MKYLLLIATLIAVACNTPAPTQAPPPPPAMPPSPEKPDTTVALRFINSYIQFTLAETRTKPPLTTWIQNNNLLTPSFKKQYQSIVNEATKDDPDGLEADPVLDAQDMPQQGFVMKHLDTATGYLTVRGRDWEDFELTMKLVQQNGKWLVDGSGYINIPDNKQAKR